MAKPHMRLPELYPETARERVEFWLLTHFVKKTTKCQPSLKKAWED